MNRSETPNDDDYDDDENDESMSVLSKTSNWSCSFTTFSCIKIKQDYEALFSTIIVAYHDQ